MDRHGFGARIRYFRSLKGLTQKELAKAAKTSSVSISRIETGNQNTKLAVIFRIAEVLNVEVREFFQPGEGAYTPTTPVYIDTLLRQVAPLPEMIVGQFITLAHAITTVLDNARNVEGERQHAREGV